ncbi:hypothetical protein CEXT_574031 [Caerostris extrusa]|uniref:Uncharacterized protein n=1 Tax=Caerostris extrusa TaxID=172846 RepID=A0AAV4SJ07_CAEEX|nr:hypothetical protein CEXT_574031 [Caerostris extrusa]
MKKTITLFIKMPGVASLCVSKSGRPQSDHPNTSYVSGVGFPPGQSHSSTGAAKLWVTSGRNNGTSDRLWASLPFRKNKRRLSPIMCWLSLVLSIWQTTLAEGQGIGKAHEGSRIHGAKSPISLFSSFAKT